jgi:hypothetical protein
MSRRTEKRPLSAGVRWHQQIAEEAKPCRFYPHCENPPGKITLNDGGAKYKLGAECFRRFKKEHPEVEVKMV